MRSGIYSSSSVAQKLVPLVLVRRAQRETPKRQKGISSEIWLLSEWL